MASCDLCGQTSAETEPDLVPLTWSTAIENGRRRVFCDVCSRRHLRAMEGKLDSPWW